MRMSIVSALLHLSRLSGVGVYISWSRKLAGRLGRSLASHVIKLSFTLLSSAMNADWEPLLKTGNPLGIENSSVFEYF